MPVRDALVQIAPGDYRADELRQALEVAVGKRTSIVRIDARGLRLLDSTALGVLLWAGVWIGVGYVFSDAVAVVALHVAALGLRLSVVLAALLGGYILIKYARRRLYLRRLRAASVSPQALKRRLDAGEDVTIVDLRTPLDVAAVPYAIPGSRWVEAEHIDRHEAELRGRDLILYCS